MRIEQGQRNLAGIEVWCLCNTREWGRLVGRDLALRRLNDMASCTPSVSEPFTIVLVGTEYWFGH